MSREHGPAHVARDTADPVPGKVNAAFRLLDERAEIAGIWPGLKNAWPDAGPEA